MGRPATQPGQLRRIAAFRRTGLVFWAYVATSEPRPPQRTRRSQGTREVPFSADPQAA